MKITSHRLQVARWLRLERPHPHCEQGLTQAPPSPTRRIHPRRLHWNELMSGVATPEGLKIEA